MKQIAMCIGLLVLTASIQPAHAIVAEEYAGEMVTDIDRDVTWYVYPETLKRYKVEDSDAVHHVLVNFAKGITNADLEKVPNKKTNTNNLALRQRLAGYFYLQIEAHGEAWYISPTDLKRHSLGNDAAADLEALSTKVSHEEIKPIQVGKNFKHIGATGDATTSSYTITTSVGSFAVIVTKIPRGSYELITDTGNTTDCTSNCAAKSLQAYVQANNAEGGMHGTYFCPPDYSSCAGQTNSFLPPMFNTAANTMMNAGKLPFHSGPMIVSGKDEKLYYYHRTKDFGYTVGEFEDEKQTLVEAAIANYPALVEDGNVIVQTEYLDAKQRDVKSGRGGIGYDPDYIYFVIARSATVTDLAYIFDALNVKYAINLDGGGSVALYDDGKYYIGPGRTLPNAIMYQKR